MSKRSRSAKEDAEVSSSARGEKKSKSKGAAESNDAEEIAQGKSKRHKGESKKNAKLKKETKTESLEVEVTSGDKKVPELLVQDPEDGTVQLSSRRKRSRTPWPEYYEDLKKYIGDLKVSIEDTLRQQAYPKKKQLKRLGALREAFDFLQNPENLYFKLDRAPSKASSTSSSDAHATSTNLEESKQDSDETATQDEFTVIPALQTPSSDEEDDGSDVEMPSVTPQSKQPVFPVSEYDDLLYPEEQKSEIGGGIRAVLKERKSLGSSTPKRSKEQEIANDVEVIKVENFTPKKAKPEENADFDSSNGPVPWLKGGQEYQHKSLKPTLRLHNEILRFISYITERPHEKSARQEDVEKIREVATEIWPECQLEVFGSFANNLCIPTSDVDLVLFNVPSNAIFKLSKALRKKNLAEEMEVISTAKVPIIKLRLPGSNYTIDISFDIAGGIETGKMIRRLLKEMPALRPLVLVVKFFLCQRDMNEPFKGGIGSHLCLCLVISLLQQFRKQTQAYMGRNGGRVEELEDLGTLLMEFLDLYGKRFNYAKVGISLRNGGAYVYKRVGNQNARRPGVLYVEDPEKPDKDLGTSSYNMPRIRKAFGHAHRLLIDRLSEVDAASNGKGEMPRSILEAIINVTEDLIKRQDE